MLLQSKHHFYLYENKSKYLFSLHPLITAYYLSCDKKLPDFLQKIRNKYSKQELDLYYHQYLFVKKYFIDSEEKHDNIFGRLNDVIIRNSFNNVHHIVFEVTDKCNLKCDYCAYGDIYSGYDKRNCKNLDFIKAKILLDYFIPIWGKNVDEGIQESILISFYGGEPLLNFRLIAQVVEYCESSGLKKDFFKYSMTTNGIYLAKYHEYLIEKDFRILVSLDGNKENHSFRVKKNNENSHDEIIANLELLRKKNSDYFEKNISFISVMHKRNTFLEAIDYSENKFNKLPTITPLSTDDIIPEKRDYFDEYIKSNTVANITEDVLQKFNDEKLAKYDVYSFARKNLRHYFKYYHSVYNITKNMPISPTGTCIPFTRKVFLSTNGKILPCERVHVKHTLGNVSKSKGVVLDFDAIAKYFNDTVVQFKEHCKSCYNRYTCEICAFKSAIEPCEGYMNDIDFSKIMTNDISIIEEYPHTYNYIKTIITD